jgi:tRNA pseudouridine55 synthase
MMMMSDQTSCKLASPPPLAEEVNERSASGGQMGSLKNLHASASSQAEEEDREAYSQGVRKPTGRERHKQHKREKRDVHGWVVLDKPVGMTSTHAVSVIKHLFSAKRCGHAGTLDPLASGALPIALGEATKTVPFVMDGRKLYRFTVRWGEERDTDDAEGRMTVRSDHRPTPETIRALLPSFVGIIEQVPPRYSAIKIEGERAYDLARGGKTVELTARPTEITRLKLVEVPDADHAVMEAECGKGTYVRALARDLGRALNCFGHVSALRRVAVGPFREESMILLENLETMCHRAAAGEGSLAEALMPVETALDDIPAVAISRAEAARLTRGQAVLLRGRDAPNVRGTVHVTVSGQLLALAELDRGEIVPKRIFNLAGLIGRASYSRKDDRCR